MANQQQSGRTGNPGHGAAATIPQIWKFVVKVTQSIYTGSVKVTQDLVDTAHALLQTALSLQNAQSEGLVEALFWIIEQLTGVRPTTKAVPGGPSVDTSTVTTAAPEEFSSAGALGSTVQSPSIGSGASSSVVGQLDEGSTMSIL
jgi:hypothetical protein